MVGVPLLVLGWLLSYSRIALGTDQGRLLFPAIGPLALWLVGGLGQWVPTHRRWPNAENTWLAGWASFMLGLSIIALLTGIVRPFAAPPAPAEDEVAQTIPVHGVFGGELELVGMRWGPDLEQGGQAARELILYWQALRRPGEDLRTALRLLDAEGQLLWEWKRSPGAGRFSTDRWPVGRRVADIYRVPLEPLRRASQLEIGLRPFPEGPWLSLSGKGQNTFLVLPMPDSR